jgi:sigma-54-dependent transcriptional regulator
MNPIPPTLTLIEGTGAAISPLSVKECLTPDLAGIFNMCNRLARFPDVGVLLLGEAGVGKTALARHIHTLSGNPKSPFVTVDVPQIAGSVFESILFGHKKGSFTGAQNDHDGLVLQANNGTLFFDEIGDLPLDIQAKLLRVIEEKTFRPVGAKHDVTSNFRVIAATNHDLKKMVSDKTFRKDLFDRLDTFPITIPPLRSRANDILPLAEHFLRVALWKYELRETKAFSEAAKATLQSHSWPGNVRELEKWVLRSVIFSGSSSVIVPEHFDFVEDEAPPIFWLEDPAPASYDREKTLANLKNIQTWAEMETIENAAIRLQLARQMRRNGYSAAQTAKELGIARTTLEGHIRKHLDTTQFRSALVRETIEKGSFSKEERAHNSVIRDLAQAPNRDTIIATLNIAKLTMLQDTLQETGGNQSAAEVKLGLNPWGIRHKLIKLTRDCALPFPASGPA